MEKARAKGMMRAGRLAGEVADTAIVIDDLISTGGTLLQAAIACRERGATRIYATATHGLFIGDSGQLLSGAEIDKIVVTDSVLPFRLSRQLIVKKLAVVSAAPLFAEAIRRIHSGGSLVELQEV
jgi:ribose-phosphate pyrophosphokinase